jgi:hypothetical protein
MVGGDAERSNEARRDWGLTLYRIILPRSNVFPFWEFAAVKENPMKRALRISILMLGVVGTYVAAAIPQGAALDGGPIPLCPPPTKLQIQQTLHGSEGGSGGCKPQF